MASQSTPIDRQDGYWIIYIHRPVADELALCYQAIHVFMYVLTTIWLIRKTGIVTK